MFARCSIRKGPIKHYVLRRNSCAADISDRGELAVGSNRQLHDVPEHQHRRQDMDSGSDAIRTDHDARHGSDRRCDSIEYVSRALYNATLRGTLTHLCRVIAAPHTTRCCTFDGQIVPGMEKLAGCYPMLISPQDPVYSKFSVECLNFVRSTTDQDRGCSSPHTPAQQVALARECSNRDRRRTWHLSAASFRWLTNRSSSISFSYGRFDDNASTVFQLNTVSHYLDLSLVYGSSDQVASSLRAGYGGRLNVDLKNNREFPPRVANKSATCETFYDHEPCYATGKCTQIHTARRLRQTLIFGSQVTGEPTKARN